VRQCRSELIDRFGCQRGITEVKPLEDGKIPEDVEAGCGSLLGSMVQWIRGPTRSDGTWGLLSIEPI
jgi:hypothetical protein